MQNPRQADRPDVLKTLTRRKCRRPSSGILAPSNSRMHILIDPNMSMTPEEGMGKECLNFPKLRQIKTPQQDIFPITNNARNDNSKRSLPRKEGAWDQNADVCANFKIGVQRPNMERNLSVVKSAPTMADRIKGGGIVKRGLCLLPYGG